MKMKTIACVAMLLCAPLLAHSGQVAPTSKPIVLKDGELPIVANVVLGRDLAFYPECNAPEATNKNCSFMAQGDTASISYRPDFPKWAKEASLVTTKNGKIISAMAVTKGVTVQDDLYQMLVVRYGKPTHVKRTAVQNRMGATFQKIDVLWAKSWGSVTFESFGDNLDEGSIIGSINEAAIPAVTAALANIDAASATPSK
ncbi:MAG: hypothetical protein P4L87_01765 [Formivibrio sp.]|nr:hypothetical protein [Formivibrio sp.]